MPSLKPFEREFAHTVTAPTRKAGFRRNGQDIDDAGAAHHFRHQALRQEKGSRDINGKNCFPFFERDFAERFYEGDPRVSLQDLAQGEAIVHGFPKTEAHEPAIQARVKPRPERMNNVLAR